MTVKYLDVLPALVVLLTTAECMWAQSWVETTAPTQTWTSVASSADGVRLVAVNREGGIYISTSSGQKWVATSAPDQPWSSVASSANGTKLVALSESGMVSISTNSGAAWTAVNAPTNTWWFSVAASADGSKCVAVAPDSGIFMSSNSGANWTSTTAPTNQQWSSIASSADGTKLVAAVEPGLIYISGDSGASWTTSNVPILSWTSVASSADGTKLVSTALLNGIYASTDSGVTWMQTTAPTNEAWYSVASSSDGTTVIAAGSYGGIYTSTNSGATWSKNGAPSNTWYSVCISADGSKPVAAAHGGGIFIPGVPPATGSNSVGVAGGAAYQGLFYDTNGVAEQSSGFFSASTTSRGKFSAKLQMAGKSYPFSGRLPGSGSNSNAVTIITNTIPRKGLPSLEVVLKFESGGDELNGTVSDGVWTAELAANRTFYSKANPPPQAGNAYTVVLPGGTDSSMGMGAGFGTVSVDGSGRISLKGTMGDRTKIAQQTSLSKQNQWPLFASLYSGTGSILGWLTLTNEPGTDIDGRVNWIKLSQPGAKYYPAGFTNEVQSLGSLFQPAYFDPILNFSKGRVWFVGGNLSGGLTNRFMLRWDSTILNLSSNKLTLNMAISSGLFSGTVANPATQRTISFNGVVLQKQGIGLGYFLGTDKSGSVFLGSDQ